MQVAVASSTQNSPRSMKAAALSTRLDNVNEAVFASGASQSFKDGVVKMGVAFASFLMETMEAVCFLPEEVIENTFNRIEEHCVLLESAFHAINEGMN